MKKSYLFITLLTTTLFCATQGHAQKLLNTDMVKVEGGAYLMGSKDGDKGAQNDEQKQHEVKINSFEISKFEVTVWQWKKFVKATKSKMPEAPTWGWKDNFPMNQITWEQAISYCNWLSKSEKLQPVYFKNGPNYICDFKANGYRLPTEAEWEFAAKGGKLSKETKYSGGDNANQIAWHKSNSNGTPHTIGTKMPNELGIYDMSGNLWEWCWDWYNEDYYKTENINNPIGPEMGEKRTVRGGSWDSNFDYLRPANRISTYPDKTHQFYGFRIAKSILQ
jgi:sulfatase modifying factor 1